MCVCVRLLTVAALCCWLGEVACGDQQQQQQPISTAVEEQISDGDNNATSAQVSSPLAKFVLLFSRPGAFAKEAHAAFGAELNSTAGSSCPPGEEGLTCRRMEARKGADECAGGGSCSVCYACDEARVLDWPRCCKKHFLCCTHLAAACQRCDHPELAPFCAKRFKRCF